MIPIDACEPLSSVRADLTAWQIEVDARRRPYVDHICAAEEEFARRRGQIAFEPVTALLRAMCSGVTRCMYCQDSRGVDVEHYRPKGWYPEMVFSWANFLLVCTRCNRKKSSRFPLFFPTQDAVYLPTRSKNKAPRRAPIAAPVLLNPRIDDPFTFLTLDLMSTFSFIELGASSTEQWRRAHHTIEVLDLNDDDLLRSRRGAYDVFLSHLFCAVSARQRGDTSELARVREAVASTPCSAVRRTMQLQQARLPTLRAAFAIVPEALGW